MKDILEYIIDCMVDDDSPAEEVLTVDGNTVCVRDMDNNLIAIMLKPVKSVAITLEPPPTKKKPPSKKSPSKKE